MQKIKQVMKNILIACIDFGLVSLYEQSRTLAHYGISAYIVSFKCTVRVYITTDSNCNYIY